MADIQPDGIRPMNFKGNLKKQNKQASPEAAEVKTQKETGLSSHEPAASLGRSQIKKKKNLSSTSFDGKLVANITKDLEILRQNPELVKKSDLMFGAAFKKAMKKGESNPYAVAVNEQIKFVQEFKS